MLTWCQAPSERSCNDGGVNGADFVVVANRLPVDRTLGEDGRQRWTMSPGGLVTALQPVMAARRGAWVGWAGFSGDPPAPFTHETIDLRPVGMSDVEFEEFYEGFSNATIWPLYHDCVQPPVIQREWWHAYVEVNQRFAKATAKAASRGATVWIHDYQLQLVPAMLRALRPDLRIGFFLHIPFPPQELFMMLPWRRTIVEGLLGADLVGFQRPVAAQNFLQLARRLVGVHANRSAIEFDGRTVRIGAFPISIDFEAVNRVAASPATASRAAAFRKELGSPKTVLLGVDRLDYTKGIDTRLQAYEELLEAGRISPPETVLVQVATPSRERLASYRSMRDSIEQRVGRINGRFGQVGQPAIHYLHQSFPREELVALYCMADIMLVTPLRDGMNLVAKEYVAARHRGGGVLVLSEFAGAAAELRQALLVNPHDIAGVSQTIERALALDPAEARRRMRELRRQVRVRNVHLWARRFLDAHGQDAQSE